jgi:hypothetical protein
MMDSSPENGGFAFAEEFNARPRHRYWLHALLLVATLLSTTIVGAGLALAGSSGLASFAADLILCPYVA